MSWSKTPSTFDFSMDKEPFGTGGFKQAFKGTSNDKEFQGTWVIKKHLPKSISDIQATGQPIEQQTKKVVQMHYLARNFAALLSQEL